MLVFERNVDGLADRVGVEVGELVIAGWTGRDRQAIDHHLAELAQLGVKPPSATPLFYRVSNTLITQTDRLQVLGPDTSGEAEAVIVALADGLWLACGSDQTDRKAEAASVAIAKQLGPKVIGRALWRLDDVLARWDELRLRAWATIGGKRVLYQNSALSAMLRADDLIRRYTGGAARLAPGTVMFCGTVVAVDGVRPADRFEVELADPLAGRALTLAYDIDVLPVVS
jgi:hypothetical protein